jgi:glycerol-3-phosphate cytidylyltransferase
VTKVITYGTYDLLHRGHIHLLRRARELGDHLTVGLSTSAFNKGKGKQCFQSYEDRAAVVSAIRHVDFVIPEDSWDQKISDIESHQIDIFVMGDDWLGKFDFLRPLCKVIYLPRTPGISTTLLKKARSPHNV